MSSPSEPLREEWDVDGALNPVWKALSLHNAADAVKQLQHDCIDVKRGTVLALCVKFAEEQRDKQLETAFYALRSYLLNKGVLLDTALTPVSTRSGRFSVDDTASPTQRELDGQT